MKKTTVVKTFLEQLNNNVRKLNNSKFFSGLMMVLLNIGSKYITVKLSDSQKNLLNKYTIFRQLLIFSIFWMGTKDLYTSLIMTAVFIVLTQHLFNEESRYCMIPKRWREISKHIDKNNDGKISDDEIDYAIKVLQKTKLEKKKEKNESKKPVQEHMRNCC